MSTSLVERQATRRRLKRKDAPPAPPAAWANRIVGSGEEAPEQLLANPRNWRIHPEAQEQALAGVLGQVGWVQQVLVNRRTGHVVDLSAEEEALVLASLDPLAAMAVMDEAKLRELLAEVTVDSEALAAMLAELMPRDRTGLTDPDDVPEVPAEPYVKPGELWLLGEHRLLCGDATSPADVARLLDGAEPRLLATDPPWPSATMLLGGGRLVRVDFSQHDVFANDLQSFRAAEALDVGIVPRLQGVGGPHPLRDLTSPDTESPAVGRSRPTGKRGTRNASCRLGSPRTCSASERPHGRRPGDRERRPHDHSSDPTNGSSPRDTGDRGISRTTRAS